MNEGTRAGHRARPAWPRAAIVTMTAVALLAAACGGSPSGHAAQGGSRAAQSNPRDASSRVGTVYAQALAYGSCMRTHGVPTWPDPSRSGVFDKSKISPRQLGLSRSQIEGAQSACRHLQPNYASAGPTAAEVRQVRAQALRFSRCMRSHGITDFPDPGSRGGIRIPHSIENSAQYDAALNACKPFPPPPYPG